MTLKVTMSWGHDEYLYQCLLHNGAKIPKEGLYCIRFHSFYPWHTGGDYKDLANEDLLWTSTYKAFSGLFQDTLAKMGVGHLHIAPASRRASTWQT